MPHWPDGSEAFPAPDGHEYLVADDGLIIGTRLTRTLYGRSAIADIAPLQVELNRAYDPDMIAKRKAEFDALPWWRKVWLRWRYR